MRTIIILIILLLTFSCKYTDKISENLIKLELDIKGKQYDSISMVLGFSNHDRKKIAGISDGSRWIFLIPKEDYEKSDLQRLYSNNRQLAICCVFGNDTITEVNRINIDSINHIQAIYCCEEEVIYYTPEQVEKYGIDPRDAKETFEYLFVPESEGYSLIYDSYLSLDIRKDYNFDNETTKKYLEASKQYPNNKYILLALYKSLAYFQSKEDIQKIYNNFSNNLKETYFGREISRFLNQKFQNMELLSTEGNLEPLIQNFSKHNLIIFSATWCSPCIQNIPKYKEIYDKYRSNIIFTYLSYDTEDKYEKWKELMKIENIEWRSLFVGDKEKTVDSLYFCQYIPYMLLVEPNSAIHYIDLDHYEDNIGEFYNFLDNVIRQ